MKILPPEMAGEAKTGSPTSWSTSWCFGPAVMRNLSPSWLVIRIFPSNATGDAKKIEDAVRKLDDLIVDDVFDGRGSGITAPSMAVVRKTLLLQTIGDECPRPGIAAFHLMFFVGVHSSGRFFSSETPWPRGPRHCGQLSKKVKAQTMRTRAPTDPPIGSV